MHVCVFVYACISENDTLRHGNRCHVPETRSVAQSAGHTQGTPEHLSIHFYSPSANILHTRFGAPLPAARVQGSWSVPHVLHGGLQCTIRALQTSPVAHHYRSGRLESIQLPGHVGSLPWKTPSDRDLLMSVYVCICTVTYIRICMHMYI